MRLSNTTLGHIDLFGIDGRVETTIVHEVLLCSSACRHCSHHSASVSCGWRPMWFPMHRPWGDSTIPHGRLRLRSEWLCFCATFELPCAPSQSFFLCSSTPSPWINTLITRTSPLLSRPPSSETALSRDVMNKFRRGEAVGFRVESSTPLLCNNWVVCYSKLENTWHEVNVIWGYVYIRLVAVGVIQPIPTTIPFEEFFSQCPCLSSNLVPMCVLTPPQFDRTYGQRHRVTVTIKNRNRHKLDEWSLRLVWGTTHN